MTSIVVVSACALAMATGLALAGAPRLSIAANAPSAPALLAANDTGNDKVDHLNAGQIEQNYKGPYTFRGAAGGAGAGTTADGAPATAPPPEAR